MFELLLTFAPLLGAAPAPVAVGPQEGQAQTQAARVKKGSKAEIRPFYDRKTPVLLELPEGALVEIVRQNVPWSEVRVPGGLEVWVHGDYVEWKDGKVHAKTSRLRARPLPSTSGNSQPVGKLSTDWALPVLAKKDAWLKVLAPEDLSAWVLTEQLEIPATRPIGWAASWKAEANKRRLAVMATAEAVEDETPIAEGPQPEQPGQDTEKPASGDGGTEAGTPPANATAKPEAGAAAPAAAVRSALLATPVSAELLKKDPALAVVTARKNLDAHADEVTTQDLALYSEQVLENVEMIFTGVLLASKEEVLLRDARAGLTRADALRRFHRSAMETKLRESELQQGLRPGTLTDEWKKTGPLAGEGKAVWVGHLVHKPHQYPETPFVAVRGNREVLVHSFDGRFYLRDYLGREVVVQGVWRASGKDGKQRVISVEKIRTLPRTLRAD